jgi:hypothetical protein
MIKHIEHLEDLIFSEGIVGGMKINNYLWAIQNGTLELSRKWDGSPSIFAGWDEKGFFVSTKSFLNKTESVRYYSEQQLKESLTDNSLIYKLSMALEHLEPVIPHGLILQGDLLFIPNNPLYGPTVDYDFHNQIYSFQPNVIQYSIDGEYWQGWRFGVVWHTWIDRFGNTSHPKFGNLLTTKRVLSIDPTISDYKIDDDIVTGPEDLLLDLDKDFLEYIVNDKALTLYLKKAYNFSLKNNVDYDYDFLMQYLYVICQELIKKSNKQAGLWQERFSHLSRENDVKALINYQNTVRESKQKIINSLELNSRVKTHVIKTKDKKPIRTSHEGYVIHTDKMTLKIIDRNEFSRINFSDEYVRGWKS